MVRGNAGVCDYLFSAIFFLSLPFDKQNVEMKTKMSDSTKTSRSSKYVQSRLHWAKSGMKKMFLLWLTYKNKFLTSQIKNITGK